MASVVVIGAGIGGIAAAARLARLGFRVTLVEKCDRPGGRCGLLVKEGHRIDTGATLFLMPELYARTFADLGERMEDHLDLRRADPTYRIYFADGATLDLTSDLQAMQAQLEAIEPGSYGAFLRYLDEGHRHYHLAMEHLVGRHFGSPFEFFSPKNLLVFYRLKALVRHTDHIRRYFQDPRLQAAFTFQNMYMGLSPYEAPATYSLLQYSELADGVWFPRGGMYRVIEVLAAIAENLGVECLYNAPVKRINVAGRRATGVTLSDGRRIDGDLIVANADLAYVYRDLLPDDGTYSRLKRKKYGCSALVFYWGLDKPFPQLRPHNLFLAADFRQGFDPIFEALTLPEAPHFYVHAPVRIDPSLAPAGQDTLMAALPVGHIDEAAPQDWAPIQERARSLVLQRLGEAGFGDLEGHIKFEVRATPRDWQVRYNLVKGSTHGLSHHLTQMGYLRPHNRHAGFRNLYFVGASTHPGTGMPTVLVSARLVAERIAREVGVFRAEPMLAPGFAAQPRELGELLGAGRVDVER